MDTPSFQYDEAHCRIVLENTNEPVAHGVNPAHGLLLAGAPLFKIGCERIESILHMEQLTYEQRVRASRELLGTLLESFQREQIRVLPETA